MGISSARATTFVPIEVELHADQQLGDVVALMAEEKDRGIVAWSKTRARVIGRTTSDVTDGAAGGALWAVVGTVSAGQDLLAGAPGEVAHMKNGHRQVSAGRAGLLLWRL